MLRLCLAAVIGLSLAMPAAAATWGEALFDSLSHDFGSVARGPTLTHSFRITNSTGSPLHIAGIRVSCGCVTATALAADVAPGQATEIQAHMDSRRFSGSKSVTIYVQFDRPAWDEVRLTIAANGHDDLSVTPQSLSFGSVPRGSNAVRSATVTIVGSGTQLVGVQAETNYVQLAARQVRASGLEIVYEVTATLRSDTPPGKWYTDVWLTTNSPTVPRMRLPLSVEVAPMLQLSMPAVAFGTINPGERYEKRLILRGPQPFKIMKIAGADEIVTVADSADDARPVHVLIVGIKPGNPGDLTRTLHIVTDLPSDGSVDVPVTAAVLMPHAE